MAEAPSRALQGNGSARRGTERRKRERLTAWRPRNNGHGVGTQYGAWLWGLRGIGHEPTKV